MKNAFVTGGGVVFGGYDCTMRTRTENMRRALELIGQGKTNKQASMEAGVHIVSLTRARKRAGMAGDWSNNKPRESTLKAAQLVGHGMSHPEAASMAGCKLGTLRAHLRKGRA